MIAPSFDEEIDRYHQAVPGIMQGDPALIKELYSRLADVSLANPLGGIAHGWAQVEARLDLAARHYSEGTLLGFDTISSYAARDTAYLVELEHFRAKAGDGTVAEDFTLRATSIFRREEGFWKLVHRHSDATAHAPARHAN
ncbi:nuclear transport factor 2 family protein [Pseudarthrobacter sp. PS3-L1]|uniref:YybH family protein n=1 Tax=Pseudarthrobacter sp. PS3-L1 TaxID=3046207 RepID=UPI0024BB5D0A|nr:nuclear transport factor 2 family protein [Pseudarthrobacter sp. PS3-L1]MDJ0319687.1 nuclear transport factor 2 family protein [Pseudarthrobacter sp. PS3-L1]